MNTAEIAARLVTLCRQEKWQEAQRELYAQNAVSIEPHDTPMAPRETKGLPAIMEKGRKFTAMVEKSHKVEVSEPVVAENSFAFAMKLDLTMKGQGRTQMGELCVYEVKDGQIVAERFFM